jgi:RNA polymerase sigma factor (sigma-70 family)
MAGSEQDRARRFDALFAAYGPDVVAYCGWRAASSDDAQDAVSEVFLTAWRRLDEVPGEDAARVWLYACARRVMANQRRAGRRRAALHERLAAEAVIPPEPGPRHGHDEAGEERALVHLALAALGPRDREVLLLAEWEGLTPEQIGAVTGCLAVTARGRLHRARRRFRAAFDPLRARGDTSEPGHQAPALSALSSRSPGSVAGPRPTARVSREGGS